MESNALECCISTRLGRVWIQTLPCAPLRTCSNLATIFDTPDVEGVSEN